MHRFRHGLVAGRFLPVHAGHEQLLDEAGRRCARVTVAVIGSPSDPVPVELRVAWLRERRPDADVVAVTALDDTTDLAALQASAGSGPVVDVLVGGDDADRALARRLHLAFIELGPARRHVAVSSAVVHSAPGRHWSLLSAPVRAWYAQRIVVLGAEATGSARLSAALADALRCGLVPDVGRAIAEHRGRAHAWTVEDFRDYAELQVQAEESAARVTPTSWLVCNADTVTVDAWHLRCLGVPPASALADPRPVPPPRLYVLTAPDFDVPGGGPMGGPAPRLQMHALLRRELARQPVPWVEVRGSVSARVAQALDRLPELQIPSLSGIDTDRLDAPGRRASPPPRRRPSGPARGGVDDAEE